MKLIVKRNTIEKGDESHNGSIWREVQIKPQVRFRLLRRHALPGRASESAERGPPQNIQVYNPRLQGRHGAVLQGGVPDIHQLRLLCGTNPARGSDGFSGQADTVWCAVYIRAVPHVRISKNTNTH